MSDREPQHPLPPEIYRRRRALALGVAAVAIAAVVAVIAVVVNLGSGPEPASTAAPATSSQPPSPAPEIKSPVLPPPAELPPPTPTPTAAVTPPPVLSPGDDCPDSTLAVKGSTSAPEFALGDQPTFTMVVTNIGTVACQRDVGAAFLAAYVYSLENQRLWSNLDCAPSNETLVRTFNPGEQVTTEVTWTGMGSAPECPLPRQPIGAGTYNLVVQLGNLKSAAVPFIMAAPADPAAPAPPLASN